MYLIHTVSIHVNTHLCICVIRQSCVYTKSLHDASKRPIRIGYRHTYIYIYIYTYIHPPTHTIYMAG